MSKPIVTKKCCRCLEEKPLDAFQRKKANEEARRGYCRACLGIKDITPEQAFWSHVDKNGPVPAHVPELGKCWGWTAHLAPNGYGNFGGKTIPPGARRYAHRASYYFHTGVVPGQLNVLHKCDNRRCVRPDHLFLGTQLDNVRDMAQKGRRVSNVPKGPDHHFAKFTAEKVRELRSLYASGVGPTELGRRYGVTAQSAWSVAVRKTWKHVT